MGSFAVAPAAESYLSGAANFFFVGLRHLQGAESANTTCCITIESAKENGQAGGIQPRLRFSRSFSDLKLFDRFHSSFLLHCGGFFASKNLKVDAMFVLRPVEPCFYVSLVAAKALSRIPTITVCRTSWSGRKDAYV